MDNSKYYANLGATESIKNKFRNEAGNVSATPVSLQKVLQKRSQITSQHPDLSHLDHYVISELPVLEEKENRKVVAAKEKF